MTKDERKAAAFLMLLITLAGVARALDRPGPADVSVLAVVDVDSLETASRALAERAERRRRGMASGETLDPNTAPVEELERLPGVGPALAQRIVDHREAHGAFRTTGDLRRVPGIGNATIQRITGHLELPSGPETVPPTAEQTSGQAASGPGLHPQPARPPPQIALNRATQRELESLPGIGPALAARIIAYRDSMGGFASIDELERVSGIGPARLAVLRPRLILEP